MLILGFHGTRNRPFGTRINHSPVWGHDAAAVLIENGKIIAAIEDERLNRRKHSVFFPAQAIQFCLSQLGASISDIDIVATASLNNTKCLRELFPQLKSDQFYICDHEIAHINSAYYSSGFSSCLGLSLDGVGGDKSGLLMNIENCKFETLKSFSIGQSIGNLYSKAVMFLGMPPFSEYKIMGLASYGNPQKFADFFSNYYSLNNDGSFELRYEPLYSDLVQKYPRRISGGEFTQLHMDIAAAFQYTTEAIVFHILKCHQKLTGHSKLCYAGGVAQNSTLNGKIHSSGLFSDVFIQPASHDSGLALGAALGASAHFGEGNGERISHCYWGPDIGDSEKVASVLKKWSSLISFEHKNNISEVAAQSLADGKIIGWVQGRSEFGPRALGNRSILADPRPADNKSKINEIIKFREGFRPFAPSVVEERAAEFFVLTETAKKLPFMTSVVSVKNEKRDSLKATTHFDGTARLQTVSRETNPKYWELINHFGLLTSVPVVLNTSFNNNAEPIVESIEDALNCYLTTNLDLLYVGNFIVKKIPSIDGHYNLVPKLNLDIEVTARSALTEHNEYKTTYRVEDRYHIDARDDYLLDGYGLRSAEGALKRFSIEIEKEMYDLLSMIDGKKTLLQLADSCKLNHIIMADLYTTTIDLWHKRYIYFSAA